MYSLIQLNPDNYTRHYIHGDGRSWAETNCYVDVLIELIHSLGFDPVAALAFTVSIDFEVDQWTFFKYEHVDLQEMYGMNVQELNPWVSLEQHIDQQVGAGRPVLVEVDSYFLPDTVGTAYKTEHVKSTIAVTEFDLNAQHMGYFHGQGYYHLGAQDYRDLFQVDGLVHERMLPPYIELVKLQESAADHSAKILLRQSLHSLRRQLQNLPKHNPFAQFKARFKRDLEWLREEPIETFHGYSFATLRQYGACFELQQTYLEWLQERGESGLAESIDAFRSISNTSKVFQFKLARAIARDKDLDFTTIDQMAELWHKGTESLVARYL